MKNIIGFLFLFIAMPVFSQITVEGTVTDANGKPPILAHTHIEKYNDMKHSTSYECAKNGHFSFQIPIPGIYSLRISAVSHGEITIPLILDASDKNIRLNVQLRPDPFESNPKKVAIIGDWNNFAFSGAEKMTVQTSGGKAIYTYEHIATGDTLSYQIMGIVGERSVNGTMADYYTYDGGGDYRSVIRTHKGDKVTISFDPSKVNYSTNKNLPIVEIKNNPFLNKVYMLTAATEKMSKEAYIYPTEGGPVSMSGGKYKALLEYIKNVYYDAVKSGDIKFSQYAAVMLAKEYNPTFDFGSENAALIVHAIPSTSPFWVLAPFDLRAIAALVDKKTGDDYIRDMKNNPEKTVQAIALSDEMGEAVKAKDTKEWKRLYDLLKKDYNDVPEIKWAMTENNPEAIVQVGKPVPPFEVALLDGSGKVSNTSMLGKYYMIDFWATWCGPCVGEMPSIHKAYEKFKGKQGFEILSLSMDGSEKQIAPFRANKWKMPWLNAFIPGVFEADLAKKFEVVGIPKPVLVGPDGNIVAMQEDLRGENLEKTLAKFLGETN